MSRTGKQNKRPQRTGKPFQKSCTATSGVLVAIIKLSSSIGQVSPHFCIQDRTGLWSPPIACPRATAARRSGGQHIGMAGKKSIFQITASHEKRKGVDGDISSAPYFEKAELNKVWKT